MSEDQAAQQPPVASRSDTASARSKRAPGGRESLDDLMKLALESLDAPAPKRPPRPRPARPVPQALKSAPGAVDVTPARSRLSLARALLIAGLLIIVAGGWSLARSNRKPEGPFVTARAVALPILGAAERASVSQTLGALHDLQSVSRIDVPHRVYATRIAFAKTDLDRHLGGVNDPDLLSALRGTFALHRLAARAWEAKTFNAREQWEAVGDDPAVELCPAVKRLLAIADEPAGMSRSAWRGITIAAAIPLLWDCAADRFAGLDRAVREP